MAVIVRHRRSRREEADEDFLVGETVEVIGSGARGQDADRQRPVGVGDVGTGQNLVAGVVVFVEIDRFLAGRSGLEGEGLITRARLPRAVVEPDLVFLSRREPRELQRSGGQTVVRVVEDVADFIALRRLDIGFSDLYDEEIKRSLGGA